LSFVYFKYKLTKRRTESWYNPELPFEVQIPDELKQMDKNLLELLSSLLEVDFEKRIKIDAAYDHDWLYLAYLDRNERASNQEKYNKFQLDLINTHRMNIMVESMKEILKDYDTNRFMRGRVMNVIHHTFNSVLL
jgi:serine/threonine protein kinase